MFNSFNWKGFSILSFAHLINDFYTNFLPPMLPFFIAAGAFDIEKGATIVAAFTISSSLTQPLFGYLVDQKGQRWLLFVGTLWMAVLLGFIGFTNNYYSILILATLAGMGTSAFHPQAAAMVSNMGGKRQGTSLSTFIAFGNIGMALGPIVLMPLFKIFGLWITGLATIPGILASLLLFFYAPQEQHLSNKPVTSLENAFKALKKSMAELIKLMNVVAMRSLVFTGIISLLPYYFVNNIKLSEAISGTIVTITLASGAVGGLIGGTVSDRFGKRGLIIISLAASAPLLLAFLKTQGIISYIFLALGTATLMASFSVTVVAAQEVIPDSKALAAGLSMGFAIGIGGLGVKFIGRYADIYGIQSALQMLFYLPFIAAAFGFFLKKEQKVIQIDSVLTKS